MLADFLNDPLGLAVQGAVVAAFLDFAFGVFAALKDGTFAMDAVAAFVRKHILGRVLPAGTLAVTAFLTDNQLMAAAAIGALAAYAAETLASIYGSISPPEPEPLTPEERAAGVAVLDNTNPVPTD